jgi:hypothetical protein
MGREDHDSLPGVALIRIRHRVTQLPGRVDSDLDIIVGVEGEFALYIDDLLLYSDEWCCLVELAAQVNWWLDAVRSEPWDFQYTSIESDEAGLIWIKYSAPGWRIGSVHQAYDENRYFTLAEIADPFAQYVDQVRAELRPVLGGRIDAIIESRTDLHPKSFLRRSSI